MILIREGAFKDVDMLVALDHVALRRSNRADYITSSIRAGDLFVAVRNEAIVGYEVLTHSFYGNGMIELLYVTKPHRRAGITRTRGD